MAFPAIPRNAKGYDIENAINRILRWLNSLTTRGDLLVRDSTGDLTRLALGADGDVLSSDGTDAKWQKPTLSYLTNALTADVTLNNTTSWFTGPSVAQGTTGIWLAMGKVVLQDTAGGATLAARLTDGTTVKDSALFTTGIANAAMPFTLTGIFSSPAGNIRIQGLDATSTSGKILYNANADGVSSTLNAVRIG